MHKKRWNGVSPNPNPSGRASAKEPIRRSTSSILPLYACLSSAAVAVSFVSFSKVSGTVKLSRRLNWLYRGTPRSRSLKMSMVAKSTSWKKIYKQGYIRYKVIDVIITSKFHSHCQLLDKLLFLCFTLLTSRQFEELISNQNSTSRQYGILPGWLRE